jgi:hypothetical protein
MRKYLQVSYYTLTGIKKLIDLGDQSYGEWIIYEDTTPKYHICLFENDASNILIKSLLDSRQETITSVIKKINLKQRIKLSFGNKPFVKVVKKEELIDLNLIQLPEHWIKNI